MRIHRQGGRNGSAAETTVVAILAQAQGLQSAESLGASRESRAKENYGVYVSEEVVSASRSSPNSRLTGFSECEIGPKSQFPRIRLLGMWPTSETVGRSWMASQRATVHPEHHFSLFITP